MTAPVEAPKLSKVEGLKEASDGLLGTLAETYASPENTHFTEDEGAVLKHHGSYQQDDRDKRSEMRKAGLDKAWIFMVRTKIPGGRMTADQWLAHDEIARNHTYGSLRITSRQGVQMHGVGWGNLKRVIRGINDSRMTTLGACGDVNRNVMACPVSDLDWRAPLGIQRLADEIAEHFAPRSTAYFEMWCDGEKLGKKLPRDREEPIYGKTYLPRKFKMAIAVPEDNCVDLYTQDLGIEVVHDRKSVLGYDMIVGGGMGFNHSKKETYPRLGTRLVRVAPGEVVRVAEEIVKIQRDFGGRADRQHARLKYLLDDRGVEWFRGELFRRLGRELPAAGPKPAYRMEDHLGRNRANDGSFWVGVHVDNGRCEDTERGKVQTGLREVVSRLKPAIRLTPFQDILFVGLTEPQCDEAERILSDHGVALAEKVAPVRRRAIACPALPTCGLALAESERVSVPMLERLEQLGSGDEPIEIRWTGCPNSCVRTPTAEIGIVGRGPGKYALYLGGSPEGSRLAYKFRETVELKDVPEVLHRAIRAWKDDRTGSTSGSTGEGAESFGDWANRLGAEGVEARVAG